MMMQPTNNSIVNSFKTQDVLKEDETVASQAILHEKKGVFVRVNQITQIFNNPEMWLKIARGRRICCRVQFIRTSYNFGNLPLQCDMHVQVKAGMVQDKKTILGWQENKDVSNEERKRLESHINQTLQRYIRAIADENCQKLQTLGSFEKIFLSCDESGCIQEQGPFSFSIEQHMFKSPTSYDLLLLLGLGLHATANNSTQSALLRETVIAATVSIFSVMRNIRVYCKDTSFTMENERIGQSQSLAASRNSYPDASAP